MLKKKWVAGLLLVGMVFCVSACGRSDKSASTSGDGNTSPASGTGTAIAGGAGVEAVAGGESGVDASGKQSAKTGDEAPSAQPSGNASASQEAGQSSSADSSANAGQQDAAPAPQGGEEVAVDGSADGNGTYDIDNQSGNGPVPGNDQSASESPWNGVYVSEEGEQLTVQAVDETTISFSFQNSGISSTAYVEGAGANYSGDDLMDVSFTLTGDVIGVTVINTETGEAEISAITGTYQRQ